MSADTASSQAGLFEITLPPSPYPGLRAFEKNEWVIYFGREKATEKVVSQLLQTQFVALHGDSGCGKSSLVRAGVLPRLERECARGGATWRTTIMLPRAAPLWNLATALAELDGEVTEARVQEYRRVLNLGADGAERLAEMVRRDDNDFVCVLIDQFEELFQFADNVDRSEAQHFIDVLTGVQRAKPSGLHFVLTMRSEFLGACASFNGLADTINETQYLLPRMEQKDLVRALCEPARLYNGAIDPALARRIIDDAGTTQDQLPLMQHAAMRLHRRVTLDLGPEQTWKIGLPDYAAAGTPAQILSDHADEVYYSISGGTNDEHVSEEGRLVRKIFQAITEDADGHLVRRPQTLGQIAELTERSIDQLLDLLGPLRAEGVSFIRIFASGPERERRIVDISHEALMRNWRKLVEWIQEETDNGSEYRRLLEHTAAHLANRNELLVTSAARRLRDWWEKIAPTQVWADRYSKRTPGVSIADVRSFIEASLDPKKREFELWREELAMAIETHADGRRGLLTGPEVEVARRHHSTDRAGELSPDERLFVERSIVAADAEQAAFQRRRRRILFGSVTAAVVSFSLAIVAGVFSIVASDESRKAQEQRNAAIQLRSELLGNMAREWLADDASAAGLLASEALSDARACGLDQTRPFCSEAIAALRAAIAVQRQRTRTFDGATRLALDEPIDTIRANYESRLLAVLTFDNTISIRNLDDGRTIATLWVPGCPATPSEQGYPNCTAGDVVWLAGGKQLLSIYYDGTMRIWDIATKTTVLARKVMSDGFETGLVITLDVDKTESSVIVTNGDNVSFVAISEKDEVPVIGGVAQACYTNGGKTILASTAEGLRLFSAMSGRPAGTAQAYQLDRLVCRSDDRALLIRAGEVLEIDTSTLEPVRTIERVSSGGVAEVALAPTSSWLAVVSGDRTAVEIIDLRTGGSTGSFVAQLGQFYSIAFADPDTLLVAESGRSGLAVWPVANLSKQAPPNKDAVSLATLARIEAETNDDLIAIMDDGQTGLFQRFNPSGPNSLASYSLSVSNTQPKLAAIRTRTIPDLVCPKGSAVEGLTSSDCDVDDSHIPGLGSKSFFLLGNGTLLEIDSASLNMVRMRPAPEGAERLIDVKDGLALFFGTRSNLAYPIVITDPSKTGDVIIHPVSITTGVVGINGELAATGDANGDVRIWSRSGGSLANWRAHDSEVASMALSEDGGFIVTADRHGEIRARTLEGDLIGEDYVGERLTDLIVSNTSGAVIAVGSSGQAYRWEVEPGDGKAGKRAISLKQRAFGENILANSRSGEIYSRTDDSLMPLVWTSVENTPPEVERAYVELLAAEPLTLEQRTSAGLARSVSAISWEVSSDACETLADHPYDPDRQTAGVSVEEIDIETAVQACEAARKADPGNGRFDMLYGRVKVASANRALKGGRAAESVAFDKEAITLYESALQKGYRYAAVLLAQQRTDLSADLLETAWNEGIIHAGVELGRRYLDGIDVRTLDGPLPVDVALGREWSDRAARKLGPSGLERIGNCWEYHMLPSAHGWPVANTQCEPFGTTSQSGAAKQALALFHYDLEALREQYQDAPTSFIQGAFESRRRVALGMPTMLAGCVHIEAQRVAASVPVVAMGREFAISPPPSPLAATQKACRATFTEHGVTLTVGLPTQQPR